MDVIEIEKLFAFYLFIYLSIYLLELKHNKMLQIKSISNFSDIIWIIDVN